MRHAQAERASASDYHRLLTEQGREQVQSVARLFQKSQLPPPQKTFCSAAARTRETLEILSEKIEFKCDTEYREDLYLVDGPKIIATLESVPSDVDVLLYVGHNPGIELAVSLLSGTHQPMGTAYFVESDWDIADWNLIQGASPKTWNLLTPSS